MQKIYLLGIILLINTCLAAQTGIDYSSPLLKKEINKLVGGSILLNEIVIPVAYEEQCRTGKFFTIGNNSTSTPAKYIYIGRVNTCRTGGCSINNTTSNEKGSEFFDYFCLFNSMGAVQQIKVYNYQATHGHEMTSKNWLKQFANYKGDEELIAGKSIDAISGATISVDAIAFDVEYRTKLLKKIVENCPKSLTSN